MTSNTTKLPKETPGKRNFFAALYDFFSDAFSGNVKKPSPPKPTSPPTEKPTPHHQLKNPPNSQLQNLPNHQLKALIRSPPYFPMSPPTACVKRVFHMRFKTAGIPSQRKGKLEPKTLLLFQNNFLETSPLS